MWKTLGGKCIYESPTGAKVYQNVLYRWLTLNSPALQTLINRSSPKTIELGYIRQLSFAARIEPADCCLLGLGGGGVAHALAPYLRNSRLLIVEKNYDVIRIARQYFMMDRLNNVSIVNDNAREFVASSKKQYQHLMIDLYDAHDYPPECNTIEFFKHCHGLLLPNGVLAINLTNLNEQWSIFTWVRTIFFQHTVVLPVKGTSNMVIFASNSASIKPILNLLINSQFLKKLSWDSKWGCIAMI